MKEFHEKIKDVVQHAAGESELSDEALLQIAAGVTSDLSARFKKAGIPLSPSVAEAPFSSSDVAEAPASESD